MLTYGMQLNEVVRVVRQLNEVVREVSDPGPPLRVHRKNAVLPFLPPSGIGEKLLAMIRPQQSIRTVRFLKGLSMPFGSTIGLINLGQCCWFGLGWEGVLGGCVM